MQRYRCKTCRKTFTATYGTIFYRKRTPEHAILGTLALLAEGSRRSRLWRAKGFKEDTIGAWRREAAQHAEQMETVLRRDFQIQRGQLDAWWAYVGPKSTAYSERSNLTSRMFNGRPGRKTLAFSKDLQAFRASATWEDSYSNLIRPHKSLRLPVERSLPPKWSPRPPAMAANLTDHIWTVKELLTTLPLPDAINT